MCFYTALLLNFIVFIGAKDKRAGIVNAPEVMASHYLMDAGNKKL